MSFKKAFFGVLIGIVSFSSFSQSSPTVQLDQDSFLPMRYSKIALLEPKKEEEVPKEVVSSPVSQIVKESVPPSAVPYVEEKVAEVPNNINELKIEDLSASEEENPQAKFEKESVRGLFVGLNEAFAKKDASALAKFYADKFVFIQSDQAIYKDSDSLSKYFFEKTKFESFVNFVSVNIQDKIYINLSSDLNHATTLGKGVEKYQIGDSIQEIPVRWSASLEKVDGNWKISTIHFGADHLDNQILSNYESLGWKIGVIAFVVGVIIGMFLAGIMLRLARK